VKLAVLQNGEPKQSTQNHERRTSRQRFDGSTVSRGTSLRMPPDTPVFFAFSCTPTKRTPARTSGSSSDPFTFRQRSSAIASSLNAIISAFMREPAPLVTRCRRRTVANGDSMMLVVRRWRLCSAGKS